VAGAAEGGAPSAAGESGRRGAQAEAEAEKVAKAAADQARRAAQEHFARKVAERAARDAEEEAQKARRAREAQEAREAREARETQKAADAAHQAAEQATRREAIARAQREEQAQGEEQAQRDAALALHREAEARAQRDAQARARHEADERARHEAEERARLEAEAATRRAAAPAQREPDVFDADVVPAKTPAETLILVADDSKVVRIKATKLLAQHGYRVATAVDGLDAIQQVEAEMPDLIVTDVEMPNLDGFGLARHLKAQATTAHVPIVMITSADDSHREIAHSVGVGLVLGKPFPEQPLLEHIRSFRFPACAPARPGWASTGAGALA
jgi:CheY-like chemotaxis protein